MRLVRFDDERGGDIDLFGSVGIRPTPLVHRSKGHEDGGPHSTDTAEGLTAIVFEGEALDGLADR